MTPEELKNYFEANPVPVGTMLNKGTRIADPDKFIQVSFLTIASWKGDISKCPAYWHLCELYQVMTNSG